MFQIRCVQRFLALVWANIFFSSLANCLGFIRLMSCLGIELSQIDAVFVALSKPHLWFMFKLNFKLMFHFINGIIYLLMTHLIFVLIFEVRE